MTERETELTRIIAELKVVQGRIDGNLDLDADDKKCIGGPLSDAIADAEYNLQAVMDKRIQDVALFGAGRPSVRRSALYTPNVGVA